MHGSLLLTVVVVIAVAACGAPEPAPDPDEQNPATPVATAPGPDSALAAATQAGEQQAISQLPPGPGRDVVSDACLTCHGPAIIQMQRKDRDRWARSVRRMVDWGALLSAEQEQVVVDYLAEHFAPEATTAL